MGTALGTILTGSGLLTFRLWRGEKCYPSLPGHWLLWFGLVAAIADGAAIWAFYYRARQDPSFPAAAYFVQFPGRTSPQSWPEIYNQVAGWGLGAMSSLVFAWVFSVVGYDHALGFRVSCVLCRELDPVGRMVRLRGPVALSGIRCVGSQRVALLFGSPLCGVCLPVCSRGHLTALALDFRCRDRFDGLHWVGVGMWLGIASVQLAVCVYTLRTWY